MKSKLSSHIVHEGVLIVYFATATLALVERLELLTYIEQNVT